MKRFASTQFLGRSFLFLLGALVLALVVQTAAWAQTGTGTVSGTVTDPQKAVVQGATVTLTNTNTGIKTTETTQADGRFVANVPPGTYDLTVTGKGFDTSKITGLVVKLGVNTNADIQMKIGTPTETVEVKSATTDLQTLDASVGNVMDQTMLEKLPSLSRDATAILLLQPLAQPGFNGAPGSGEGNLTGGGIAGARADQNTFMLDGGDATSNTEGGGGYAQQSGSGFSATPRAAIPTPVESLQEMRVVTNNSNTFARSAGGEIQMVTRSGGNQWHGAVYENNQNTDYNANQWQLNKVGRPRGIWLDNRFGGRVGGPLKKDKAFFFLMYEGHKFKKANTSFRLVPSALMRQGILQWKDTGGTVHQENLATGTACGGSACDPRHIGISPVIKAIWNTLPAGNNTSEGDGLNAIGFDYSVPVVVNDNYAVGRFDYKFNDSWSAYSTYHYAVSDGVGSGQTNITGGNPVATRSLPTQPRYFTFGATGRLSTNISTEAHFNWLRHWWQWKPQSPKPQVAGTAAALQIYAESVTGGMVPINVDTQNARSRVWNGKDFTWSDNSTWLHGKHMFVWGGEFRHEHFLHQRDDKVVGALTTPVYFADKTSDINTFAAAFQPTGMAASFLNSWQSAYISTTGMIARASQLLTRNSTFGPNPPGTPLQQDTIVDFYNLYFADTWRMTSNFNVTLGLGWGAQTPPFENSGEQTIMVDQATGKPIIFADFLTNLANAANGGTVFGPTLGFVPIKSLGLKYPYNAEWSDFEPRVSFAWNPSSFLGPVFGDHKSVLRGGFGVYHDRLNGVGLVMTPALGIGFGNTVNCRRVKIADTCGGSKTDPSTAFRIGVDGSSIPLPSLAAVTGAIIPGSDAGFGPANSPYEILDFRIDPKRKTGVDYTATLSLERQLPGKSLLEIGYVGRWAHHLYGAGDMQQVPYMLKLGGQTFAAAYDNIAKALRAGQPVAAQPFWEAALGPGGTATVVAAESANFIQGLPTAIFDDQIGMPFLDNQVDTFQTTTSNGNSNYNAGYVSYRKDFSHGLLFQLNYTYSHSFDTIGFTQETVFITSSDNFNPNRDYGPSQFDRRHTFTMLYVYELPFGKGKMFGGSNGVLDKIIGGWAFSGQFQAGSGIPLDVVNGQSGEEFGSGDQSGVLSAYIPLAGAPSSSSAIYGAGNVITAFQSPNQALFRGLLIADQRTGHGFVRSFPRWNMDMALSKTTSISERIKLGFGVQAVNVFNHMEFVDPNLDVSSANFGRTSTQYTSPRFLNLNIRVDF